MTRLGKKFVEIDPDVRIFSDLITGGIKTGFLKLDEHLSQEQGVDGEEKDKSGTTAVCAILTPEYVFFGNLGLFPPITNTMSIL